MRRPRDRRRPGPHKSCHSP